MYPKLMFIWRTTTQVVGGALVTWLAARGLNLDPAVTSGLQEALYGLGIAGYAFGVHWLETRRGDTIPAKTARALARLLMLGAPATLTYQRPEPPAVAELRESMRARQ